MIVRTVVLGVAVVLGGLMMAGTGSAAGDPGFKQWLAEFYATAAGEGIKKSTWDAAFTGVTEPDPQVLEKAAYQPEFTTEIWDYLDTRVHPLAIAKGRKLAQLHNETLTAVEKRFGVEQALLLAIWSIESNYGSILEQPERLFYVPSALATLAYGDPKRKKFARTQLTAALKILQTEGIGRAHLMGSWAGAMGHTQFIPTSYLAYGVDMDNNGRRDIWNSIPDALATAANLLKQNGWRRGAPWGYEVVVPAGGERLQQESKTIGEWAKQGFKRADGKALVDLEEKAILKVPAAPGAPAFLMLHNFSVIKRYNNSDSYALAVALLADRLAGRGGTLVQAWPRPNASLNAEEKIELQERLQQRGLYIGEVDGHLGPATEKAIRDYQEQAGLTPDGQPSQQLLQALRR
jgi:membrane-bound lytic murein transglycosylase B